MEFVVFKSLGKCVFYCMEFVVFKSLERCVFVSQTNIVLVSERREMASEWIRSVCDITLIDASSGTVSSMSAGIFGPLIPADLQNASPDRSASLLHSYRAHMYKHMHVCTVALTSLRVTFSASAGEGYSH